MRVSTALPEAPLDDRDIDELQALLDGVPVPLEPLDASMLDGYLCGVLVQPQLVALARWWPYVLDVDGRAPPLSFDASRLRTLALRRHAELARAIAGRLWFDPWVFEIDGAAEGHDDEHEHEQRHGAAGDHDHDDDGDADGDGDTADEVDGDLVPDPAAVYPWVAGFITALEVFPALMAIDPKRLVAPLALLYRHLSPDDLEDADDVLDEIESLEPIGALSDAVEGLVRATLLLADVAAEA